MSNSLSVTSLNTKIKSLLEATFLHITVEGEVASATYHGSGHLYFSIKDDKSSIKCVMWRSSVARMKFQVKTGERIVVHGSVGVYTPRGEYQFIATHIEPYGKGALAVAFEQLKTKLEALGYFDPSTKKPLPKFPSKIALVTASTGAALQDMLKVAQKRWASVEIVVVDVLVQGDRASSMIARGVEYADSLDTDIIVVGRGGGSTEDLWAFNEEVVATAIYQASTPVVSAVGHEVDTLISDFVADLRAPTPSAAMEMILPDSDEILRILDERYTQMSSRIERIISYKSTEVAQLKSSIAKSSISSKLEVLHSSFSMLREDYHRAMRYKLHQLQSKLDPLASSYTNIYLSSLERKRVEALSLEKNLELANPNRQSRYAWAEINRDGKKISLEQLDISDRFELLNDGVKITAEVVSKSRYGLSD